MASQPNAECTISLSKVKFSRLNPCSAKTSFRSQIKLDNGPYLNHYITTYSKLDVEKVNQLFSVNHRNVQKPTKLILDEGNKPCGLVFDIMSNGSIGDYATGERRMQFDQVATSSRIISWFTQLASAISYCKNKGIYHRNIHPSQMLLSDDFESIRVGDFSMSKETDEFLDEHVTPSDLEYLAPEVVELREHSDASDVYSFGMSLYVCVNKERRSPFVTDSRDEDTVLRSKQDFIDAGNRITIPINNMFTDMQQEKLQVLMEKCWAEIDRPTMEEVVAEISQI